MGTKISLGIAVSIVALLALTGCATPASEDAGVQTPVEEGPSVSSADGGAESCAPVLEARYAIQDSRDMAAWQAYLDTINGAIGKSTNTELESALSVNSAALTAQLALGTDYPDTPENRATWLASIAADNEVEEICRAYAYVE